MIKKPVIAVDIDDVLAAEAEFIVAYSNKRWGHDLTAADYAEDWEAMWNVGREEVERRAAELHQPGIQNSYRLLDGAKEALETLKLRYKLIILTSRREILKDETLKWVNDLFAGVFEEVHFTGFWDSLKPDRHLLTKAELAKQIGASYLIDDQPKHCFAAAGVGVKAILFGDYIQTRDLKLPNNVTRCKDWPAVLEYFDEPGH
jgi:uncharacterized HAD superfamily protein